MSYEQGCEMLVLGEPEQSQAVFWGENLLILVSGFPHVLLGLWEAPRLPGGC